MKQLKEDNKMLLDISENRRNQKIIINVSSYAKSILEQHTLFRVHSIFDSGFNLISPQGLILYCTNKNVGQNVLVLHFEYDDFDKLKSTLCINDIVKVTSNDFVFYAKQIVKYEVTYRLTYFSESIGSVSTAHLRHFKQNFFEELKLLEKQLIVHSGFEQSQLKYIQKIAYPKPYLLSFSDLRILNGQGTGLTPTGDDFIVGYSILEKALNNRMIDNLLNEFIQKNATSEISLSSYTVLRDNHYDHTWQDIVQSISNNHYLQFSAGISQAIQKGATSGRDQALGLLHRILYLEECYG